MVCGSYLKGVMGLMNSKQLKKKIENIDSNISVLINSDTNQPIEVFAIGYQDLGSKITPLSDCCSITKSLPTAFIICANAFILGISTIIY